MYNLLEKLGGFKFCPLEWRVEWGPGSRSARRRALCHGDRFFFRNYFFLTCIFFNRRGPAALPHQVSVLYVLVSWIWAKSNKSAKKLARNQFASVCGFDGMSVLFILLLLLLFYVYCILLSVRCPFLSCQRLQEIIRVTSCKLFMGINWTFAKFAGNYGICYISYTKGKLA